MNDTQLSHEMEIFDFMSTNKEEGEKINRDRNKTKTVYRILMTPEQAAEVAENDNGNDSIGYKLRYQDSLNNKKDYQRDAEAEKILRAREANYEKLIAVYKKALIKSSNGTALHPKETTLMQTTTISELELWLEDDRKERLSVIEEGIAEEK